MKTEEFYKKAAESNQRELASVKNLHDSIHLEAADYDDWVENYLDETAPVSETDEERKQRRSEIPPYEDLVEQARREGQERGQDAHIERWLVLEQEAQGPSSGYRIQLTRIGGEWKAAEGYYYFTEGGEEQRFPLSVEQMDNMIEAYDLYLDDPTVDH